MIISLPAYTNLRTLASAVPEISLGLQSLKWVTWSWPPQIHVLGHDIAYMCSKFDHSSFSRSRYMVGAHQNLIDSCDLTTPLSWMICHTRTSTCGDQHRAYLPNLKPLTPFTTKLRKAIQSVKIGCFGIVMGHSRSLEIVSFDIGAYEFLLAFHSNHNVLTLHRFWAIARYCTKNSVGVGFCTLVSAGFF